MMEVLLIACEMFLRIKIIKMWMANCEWCLSVDDAQADYSWQT